MYVHEYYDELCALDIITVKDFLEKKWICRAHRSVRWLVRHIPTQWLTFAHKTFMFTTTLTQGVLYQQWKVKDIAKHLRDRNVVKSPAIRAWSKDLDMDIESQWFHACSQHTVLKDSRLISFHVKFINRGYTLNTVCAKYMDVSVNCSFCQTEPETYLHVFWNCSVVQALVIKLIKFLYDYLDVEPQELTRDNFLFMNVQSNLVKIIITIFKMFVNTTRYLNARNATMVQPFFHSFLLYLRKYIRGEQLKFQYQRKQSQFYATWQVLAYDSVLDEFDYLF